MGHISVQPLPTLYHDRMMYGARDREVMARLEAKIDLALTRVGVVESKQAAHEAICDVRQKQFEDYVGRQDRDKEHSVEEWERFMTESRDHRNKIQIEVAQISTNILWKVVVAMFILLTGTTGAIFGLIQHGVIK